MVKGTKDRAEQFGSGPATSLLSTPNTLVNQPCGIFTIGVALSWAPLLTRVYPLTGDERRPIAPHCTRL